MLFRLSENFNLYDCFWTNNIFCLIPEHGNKLIFVYMWKFL